MPEDLKNLVKFAVHINIENLDVGKLIKYPACSVFQNMKFKKGLYVREEYNDIIHRIDKYAQSCDEDSLRCLVLGTPGIGKSMFGVYFMIYHLSKRQNVAYIPLKSRDFIYITFDCSTNTLPTISLNPSASDYISIYDGTEKDKPFIDSRSKLMILLSSPRPESYNEFQKLNCKRFFLNPWSLEEANDFIDASGVNIGDWLQRFKVVGGVPRYSTFYLSIIYS